MFWIRTYLLRGEVGWSWALEFSSFLGPVKYIEPIASAIWGQFGQMGLVSIVYNLPEQKYCARLFHRCSKYGYYD